MRRHPGYGRGIVGEIVSTGKYYLYWVTASHNVGGEENETFYTHHPTTPPYDHPLFNKCSLLLLFREGRVGIPFSLNGQVGRKGSVLCGEKYWAEIKSSQLRYGSVLTTTKYEKAISSKLSDV